jgi:hypothetical protein
MWRTFHAVDFLLTWNVRHIAGAVVRRRIEDACRSQGYAAPVLCTPEELMSEPPDTPAEEGRTDG